MKKIFTKLIGVTLGLAMAVGVGVGVAANSRAATKLNADDSSFVISLSGQSLSNASSYQTDQTTTNYNGGDATATLKWSNLNPNSGQMKGNQNTQDNNFWLYNNTALSGDVRSITLSGISGTGSYSYTANKIYAATSTSAALSTRSTSSATAGTNGSTSVTWSFTGSSGGYFAIFATKGFTSGTVTASTITVTYAPSSKADVALSCDDLELDVSDDPVSLVVAATSGGNPVNGLAYTYEIDDESVATVSDSGVVSPVAIGETELAIRFAGNNSYNATSTSISVVVSDSTLTTSNLTFTEACGGSGTASDGAVWAITSDAAESTFADDGIHYGTGKAEVQYVQLATSDIKGNVKRVAVKVRDAATSPATISVMVGATSLTCAGSTTATNSSKLYVFTGNARGSVVVRIERAEAQTGAIYVKSVVANYEQITLSNIALSGTYQTSFEQGDSFNHDGMVVTANYSDSSSEDVTSEAVWSSPDMSSAGQKTVTVSYGGKTAEYQINVTAAVMFTVTGSIENGSLSSSASVRQNTALNISINANHRYSRPASLTVTMGGNPYNGYTYNSSTGAFNIASVTGNVVISGECEKEHGYWDTDPFTVAEAKAAVNALSQNETIEDAFVEGVVSQVDSYNSTYHSITYWISDDGTTSNQLKVFGGKGLNGADFSSISDVEVCASAMVTGTLTMYQSVQEFDSNNQLVSYTAPSVETKVNTYLNSASSIALINGEENTRLEDRADSITFSERNLTDSTQYLDPFDGDNSRFQITFAGGGNDGKYYDTGSGIRTYGGGTITISSSLTIVGVSFTWHSTYKPSSDDVADCGTYDAENSTWTGSSNEVILTRPSGSGNWRLQSVSVSMKEDVFSSITDGSIKLRFGAKIPTATWDSINALENVEITGYGVALFRTTEALKDSAPSVQSLFNAEPDKANPVHVAINVRNSNIPPAAEDGYYTFVSRVNITKAANYNMYFCAQAFIVVNGEDYYFIDEEMRESVRTLAASNDGTNLSNEALASLLS